ncbi:MAG TPA: hypothetical protein VFE33_03175 [Thermoanaerobaculia bacterium]|nr:hypothetical protein [Thermoanaerobaculia bacterium]
MDRSLRRLLATALFATGLSVPTLATAAPATAAVPVRLLAPAEGTVLQGGATAVLAWAPRPGLRGEWEEWEAFFSLDGGATYPFRLTPHLDRDLRRVSFKVPRFPTRQGRLLLRVGDERREQVFELPQNFTITVPPGRVGQFLDLQQREWRRGEPARPGEAGVVAWVEGPRQGGPLREVVAAEPPQAGPGVVVPAETSLPPAVASPAPPSGAPAADPGLRAPPPSFRLASAARLRTPRPGTADLLLLLTRQNE